MRRPFLSADSKLSRHEWLVVDLAMIHVSSPRRLLYATTQHHISISNVHIYLKAASYLTIAMAFIIDSCTMAYKTIHRAIIRSSIALDPRPHGLTYSKGSRFIRTLDFVEGAGECPICFNDYLDLERNGAYCLPCGHGMCGACAGAIVARFNKCSLCKSLLIPPPIYERKSYLVFTAAVAMTYAMAVAMVGTTCLAGVYLLSTIDDLKTDMLGNGFILLGCCMEVVGVWMRRRREGIQGWRILALENRGGNNWIVLDMFILVLQLLAILMWLKICGRLFALLL